jgi:hypothetical protein
MAYRPDRGWGFSGQPVPADTPQASDELDELRRRVAEIENKLASGGR